MKPVNAVLVLCLVIPFALFAQDSPEIPKSGPRTPDAGSVASTGMSVQVERTAVRLLPSVGGKVLGFLGYGTRVSVDETVSGWSKIQIRETPGYGWIRASALTTKRIDATSVTPARPGVSGTENALAGRGFNAAVEDSWRSAAHLDFVWIDAMESFGVSEEDSLAFLHAESGQ